MTTKNMSENALKEKTLHLLDLTPRTWGFKIWGGGFQAAGLPDVISCCAGRFMAIELKAENGRPSALQLLILRKIEEAGGIAILLYPKDFQIFKEIVDALTAGADEPILQIGHFSRIRREWEDKIMK